MKRLWVPGIPFAVSLTLSLCTVGTTVGWQDSGTFLAAVRELGVVYPPGFVLYLIVCKTWTILLGFVNFTSAVHLFSSFCAALAAGAIAMAARDLLKDHDLAAMTAGALAAAGSSFWSAALLAKSYALLYLILSVLMWRMVRAEKGRDFTLIAVLIGLAWAAHPSATTVGAAFVLFVVSHRRTLGVKGIAWRTGVAAACAAGPSLLLPVLASRHPDTMFGDPTSVGSWLGYLAGGAFTSQGGTFGLESWRVVHAMKVLWEDFLLVGLALALVGLSHLALANRRLLLAMAAWVLPSAAVAVLFRIEGQLDLWLVAAWLPLHLAVAVGLSRVPARVAKAAIVSLGVAGLAWSVAANVGSVSMRGYRLAEQFGEYHLGPLDPGSILVLESDDTLATTRYLQVVRRVRTDVLIVDAGRLGFPWYQDHLRRDGGVQPGATAREFAEANVARSRAVYLETAPEGLEGLVPAGPLVKLAAQGELHPLRAWPSPVQVDEVRARLGRERGIRRRGADVEPEAYERRWITVLARAEARLGHYHFKRSNYRVAAGHLEAARRAEADRPDGDLLHLEGVCHTLLEDFAKAEPLLKSSLHFALTPRQRMRSLAFLARICRDQGRRDESMRWQEQAMGVVGSDPELRREFDQFRR